jgi:DNA-binding NtrC family response regulator
VLGKIAPEVRPGPAAVNPLPDKLAALCERRRQEYGLDQLASHLEIFGRVREQVRLAAATEVPVLILGEAGSGKQWLARTIHQQSKMPVGSFAGLDCGALPVRALTTVLFGDGTSAERCRPGTIYLREPARLPLDLQVKLAGTLREAGECPAPRILAGSETDPQEDIRAGRLNEDFFCALSTLTITLPPLRQREADLAELVERLLKRARAAGDSMVTGLTSEAWEVVRAYPWPGNLQELYGVLRSACLRATGEMIDVHHLPAPVRLLVRLQREPGALPDKPLPLDQLLEEAERRLIGLALRKAQGNRSRAAELLAIWRPRLLRRMEALGIKE